MGSIDLEPVWMAAVRIRAGKRLEWLCISVYDVESDDLLRNPATTF